MTDAEGEQSVSTAPLSTTSASADLDSDTLAKIQTSVDTPVKANTTPSVRGLLGPDIIELRLDGNKTGWTEHRVPQALLPEKTPASNSNANTSAIIYLFEGIDARTRAVATAYLTNPDSLLNHHQGTGLLSPSEKALLSFRQATTSPGPKSSPAHNSDNGNNPTLFLATWLALASHDYETWAIEKRIESGRPWQSSGNKDPADLRINHLRYKHGSAPYRPYHPLGVQGETIHHAARECVSMWFGFVSPVSETGERASSEDGTSGGDSINSIPDQSEVDGDNYEINNSGNNDNKRLIGLIIFDPPREILTTRKTYNFWSGDDDDDDNEDNNTDNKNATQKQQRVEVFPDMPAYRDVFLQNFRQSLSPSTSSHSSYPVHSSTKNTTTNIILRCKNIIRQSAFESESSVLGVLTKSLDDVELSLSKDAVLVRDTLDVWRGYFGRWRNTLCYQAGSLRHLVETALSDSGSPHCDAATVSSTTSATKPSLGERGEDNTIPQLQARVLEAVMEENAAMSTRLGSVYQAVMSTMQMVESKRAIEEAALVSKLTHLAFFFIPLTLVTGIFSMNISEFDPPPRLNGYILSSIGITTLSYLILYRETLQKHAVLILIVTLRRRSSPDREKRMPSHQSPLLPLLTTIRRHISRTLFSFVRFITQPAATATRTTFPLCKIFTLAMALLVSGGVAGLGVWLIRTRPGGKGEGQRDGVPLVADVAGPMITALSTIALVATLVCIVRLLRRRKSGTLRSANDCKTKPSEKKGWKVPEVHVHDDVIPPLSWMNL